MPARRDRRWVVWLLVVVAGLGFAGAGYAYSAGVLFESGCHLGDQPACLALEKTLRLAAVSCSVGALAVVALVAIGIRAARERRARPR